MFKLIIKDLKLQKRSFKSSLFFILIFLMCMKGLPSSSFYYLLSVTISYMFCTTAIAYEERNKCDTVIASLPLTKNEIVISRYLSVFFFSFISILVVLLISCIAKLADLSFITLDFITIEDIKKILLSSFLLCSISFPIYFRFNFTTGKIVNGIIFLIFYFTAFSISIISPMDNQSNSIQLMLQKLFTGNNSILLILICAAIFILSMLLSIHIYENKEF